MTPSNAIDPTAKIGARTKVWHWTVILADVEIGEDCNIGSMVEIGRGCKIGSGTRIGSGVFLPPNSIIGRNVFIGPGTIMTDDRYPVVRNPGYNAEPPIIEDSASIGASAVLLPGVRIGYRAQVGAGAVVTRNVDAGAIVRGEPARVR